MLSHQNEARMNAKDVLLIKLPTRALTKGVVEYEEYCAALTIQCCPYPFPRWTCCFFSLTWEFLRWSGQHQLWEVTIVVVLQRQVKILKIKPILSTARVCIDDHGLKNTLKKWQITNFYHCMTYFWLFNLDEVGAFILPRQSTEICEKQPYWHMLKSTFLHYRNMVGRRYGQRWALSRRLVSRFIYYVLTFQYVCWLQKKTIWWTTWE